MGAVNDYFYPLSIAEQIDALVNEGGWTYEGAVALMVDDGTISQDEGDALVETHNAEEAM